MKVESVALRFPCEGEQLIGVLSRPEMPRNVGLITVVAGGPQYRAGCGRQLVELAHELSAVGVPVLRFDYRGMGESSGHYQGFQHVEADIGAAIAELKRQVPEVERVVLWGGCNAASACMINAWKFPEVCSLIMGNPFVRSKALEAQVKKQHYLSRLREKEFWQKLLGGQYRIGDYMGEFAGALAGRLRRCFKKSAMADTQSPEIPFQERMLTGMQKFTAPCLFLISGRSLDSREFGILVKSSKEWDAIFNRTGNEHRFLPDADQTFSTRDARQKIIAAAREWIEKVATS
jgi:exosortase A-associated hydrolase 1